MANIYTDTDKWEDDWFLSLSPKMKCAWLYLCDTVKGCGERKISFRKISHDIGEPISREEFDKVFSGRVFWLGEGEVWIPGTLSRIYKTLSIRVPAHINAARKIVRLTEGLQLHGRGESALKRFTDFLDEVDSVPEKVDSGPEEVNSGPEFTSYKDKREKIKDKGREGGVGETTFPPAQSFYSDLVAEIFSAVREHPTGDESIADRFGADWSWLSKSGVVGAIRQSKDDDFARRRFIDKLQMAHRAFHKALEPPVRSSELPSKTKAALRALSKKEPNLGDLNANGREAAQ
ncbi:MAG: hypothetical protein RBT63_00480 [Bdellovibrionales bacterium]|jgi:hypothetical protein|nr:hypothetical protein [Bdellovibrionales bacterium]